MHRLRWTIAFLTLCLSLSAQTGVVISPHGSTTLVDAKAAVRRYCEMDAQGFRLNRDSAQRMHSVTTTKPDSEWHGIQVISEYRITAAKLNARGALVTVSYSVLGRFDFSDGYSPDPTVEAVELQTVVEGDEWKIKNDDVGPPHVLRSHTLKWMHDQAAAEKDSERKRALIQAIQDLP